MKVINERYRVLKKIFQNQYLSCYRVFDLNKSSFLNLNIINFESLDPSFFDYLLKEFIMLTSLNHNRLLKLYSFDIIKDKNLTFNNRYFYTSEFVENPLPINTLETMPLKDRVEIFLKVAKALNYLYLKGYNYDIDINNIILVKENDSIEVKLKDIVTAKVNSFENKKLKKLFMPPEVYDGKSEGIKSYIYSLGVLLLVFLNGISKFNEVNDALYSLKQWDDLKYIVSKMIDKNLNNRYDSIAEVINDLNKIFNFNYKPFEIEELEKINYNIKLCGRDKEIEKVFEAYYKGKECVFVCGDSGIGKTRFLKEIEFLFKMKGISCFSFFEYARGSVAIELVKSMFNEREYNDDLSFILSEIKNGLLDNSIYDEKVRLKIINILNKALKEKYNNRVVIIIDDFNLIDKATYLIAKELINYDFRRQIMFVLALRDVHFNDEVSILINNIKQKVDFLEISLKSLTLEHTGEMIKLLLSMPYVPKLFAKRIYEITYGNPFFISEIIKNLYVKKYLYIDKSCGIWSSDYDCDYDNMPIPDTVESAIIEQIKYLPEDFLEVLEVISIFYYGASISIIKQLLQKELDSIENILKILQEKRIIVLKIGDEGFVYDFYNPFLKQLIYDNMEQEKRKNLHIYAGIYLEENSSGLQEEIIYQFTKAKDYKKVVRYCIESAEIMKKYNNFSDALEYYQRALTYCDEVEGKKDKLDIFMNLSLINFRLGKVNTACHFLKQAKNLALEINDYYKAVDALNKLFEIYVKQNQLYNINEIIYEIETLLKKVEYLRGYLNFKYNFAQFLKQQNKLELAKDICNHSLALCLDDMPEVKGKFIKLIGDIYYISSNPDEAVKHYKKALYYFELANSKEDMMMLLNKVGIIYSDFYQDYNNALLYLISMESISERKNFIDLKALAFMNIGYVSYFKFDNDAAINYFTKALDIVEKSELEFLEFPLYCNLIGIYLRLGDFKKSYEFYLKARDRIENSTFYEKNHAGLFYYFSSKLFYRLGDYKRAREYLQKAIITWKEDNIKLKWDSLVLLNMLDVLENTEGINKNIGQILKLSERFTNDFEKAYIYCWLSFKLYEINKVKKAKDIYKKIFDLEVEKFPEYIRVMVEFLHVLFYEKSIEKLEGILEKLKKHRLFEFVVKCNLALGDYYQRKKKFYSSLNFYIQAVATQIHMFKGLPYEYNVPINSITKIKGFRLEDLDFIDQMLNDEIINIARKELKNEIKINIYSLEELLKKLTLDPIVNLNIILKYMAYIALATNYLIITDSKQPEILIKKDEVDIKQYEGIIKEAKELERTIIVKDFKPFEEIKNIICIPLIKSKVKSVTRITTYDIKKIYGYIILESNKLINNFNKKALEQIEPLTNLVITYMENINVVKSSVFDKLTSAYTRKILDDILDEHIENAEASKGYFSIAMMDLDNFKGINDTYGHLVGDRILKEFSQIVINNIRKDDMIFRYGGEEFLVLFPHTKKEDALAVAERIKENVKNSLKIDDKPVTVSIGIASFPEDAEWKEELLEKADKALYVAKEKGKNRCEVWSQDFEYKDRATDKLNMVLSLGEMKDTSKILALIEISEFIKENLSYEEIIYKFLEKIISLTKSRYAGVLLLDKDKVVKQYWRRYEHSGWIDFNNVNKKLVEKVIKENNGIYLIDWDEVFEEDFYSVMIAPLIKKKDLIGLIYIVAFSNEREYKFDDLNYLSILANLLSMLI